MSEPEPLLRRRARHRHGRVLGAARAAADAATNPLSYPFNSYTGNVDFTRQQTGERTFDLNTDGVAHYGLVADLLADTQQEPRGDKAMRLLFRSAQAYLDTWSAAYKHG